MHLSREAVGNRLQQERKRIGLNQDDFAQKVGVAKRTLAGYEGGTGDVGATVLALAAELGVDVLYIVTGARTPQHDGSITPEEIQVIEQYRLLPEQDRASVARLTTALAEMSGRYGLKK